MVALKMLLDQTTLMQTLKKRKTHDCKTIALDSVNFTMRARFGEVFSN